MGCVTHGDPATSGARVAAGWQAAPVPVVVVGWDGAVEAVTDVCRDVLPGVSAGARFAGVAPVWLREAHDRVVAGGTGEVARGLLGDRSFAAHAVPHGADGVAWWLVETTAEEALRLERKRTEFLATASSALLASLNPGRCMEMTARLAATYLADAAVVIGPGRQGWYPTVTCERDGVPRHDRLAFDPADVPGLAEALQGFPPVPSRWIDPAAAPGWAAPPGFGPVGSLVVTPLPGHGVPAGALVLSRRSAEAAFRDDEELFARLFAARAGIAMSAAHVYAEQSAITELLMRDLLPPNPREVAGIEFAGRYRAAFDTERVGGDFYDVHPPDEERAETLAVLGDVCGKGLEAAVLTGKIRTTLRALLPMADDHQRLLRLLNNALLTADSTRFATLVLASAVRAGADVRLRLTAAGHLPPLVVRVDGTVEEVGTRGTLVGVLPSMRSTTAQVTLSAGDTCLLYTDGITEARGGPLGGDMFGEQRLRTALAECGGLPAEAVVERVQMLATQWAGARSHGTVDDIALLAISAPRGRGGL